MLCGSDTSLLIALDEFEWRFNEQRQFFALIKSMA